MNYRPLSLMSVCILGIGTFVQAESGSSTNGSRVVDSMAVKSTIAQVRNEKDHTLRSFEAKQRLLEAVHLTNLHGSPDNLLKLERAKISWKRMSGVNEEPDLDDLRRQVKSAYYEKIKLEKNVIQKRLLYKKAFKCGIAPNELLDTVSSEDRVVLADFLESLRNPKVADDQLKKKITQVATLNDSEYKGEVLANALLVSIEKNSMLTEYIAEALRGVPSVKAVKKLSDTKTSFQQMKDAQQKAIVNVLSESLIEESIDSLKYIVENGESISEVTKYACYGLGTWIHREDVSSILEKKLVQRDAQPISGLAFDMRNINKGWERLDRIIRKAANPIVRNSAIDAMTIGYIDTDRENIIWKLVSDTTFSEETRSQILKKCGIQFCRKSTAKREQVEEWAKQEGLLSEVASDLISDNFSERIKNLELRGAQRRLERQQRHLGE